MHRLQLIESDTAQPPYKVCTRSLAGARADRRLSGPRPLLALRGAPGLAQRAPSIAFGRSGGREKKCVQETVGAQTMLSPDNCGFSVVVSSAPPFSVFSVVTVPFSASVAYCQDKARK